VTPGGSVTTRRPEPHKDPPAPRFLSEVTLAGTTVTVQFREGEAVPLDLLILMEDPAARDDRCYWVLYRAADNSLSELVATADLRTCPRCDASEVVLAEGPAKIAPHVQVEVRWQGASALFPVRFVNKAELPLLLLGRKPSEGELIDYFLFGKEPPDSDDSLHGKNKEHGGGADDPLDTRHILAYFMRRFVQAIPGIEAEIARAAYSRSALEAALRGTTSPLALAEHAAASLTRPSGLGEPDKSPMAVGFQLVEILAALGRSRARVQDPELQACFDPVTARCRELLDALALAHTELRAKGFHRYRAAIGEEAV
jgi:hypothetical protein